jgi:hypothetical protein
MDQMLLNSGSAFNRDFQGPPRGHGPHTYENQYKEAPAPAALGASMGFAVTFMWGFPGPPEGPRKSQFKTEALLRNIAWILQ